MASIGRKKVSTTIYVDPYQAERIQALAARTGIPQSEYYRLGFDVVLSLADEVPFPTSTSIRARFDALQTEKERKRAQHAAREKAKAVTDG